MKFFFSNFSPNKLFKTIVKEISDCEKWTKKYFLPYFWESEQFIWQFQKTIQVLKSFSISKNRKIWKGSIIICLFKKIKNKERISSQDYYFGFCTLSKFYVLLNLYSVEWRENNNFYEEGTFISHLPFQILDTSRLISFFTNY